MIRVSLIVMICISIIGTTYSCNNGDFKQTRAEMLERQRVRKIEYQAQKQAEEAEKARLEAEALAEAKIKAEKAAQEAAPVSPPVYVGDSLLLHFERSTCFRRCPAYKIKVYESGFTTYEGVNFVDNIGYYQTQLSPSEIAEIYTFIAEADFFELEDRYDNENIMDLPSMTFRAKAMGKDKQILARYEIPEALLKMASDIDELFEGVDWMPAKSQ
ncbi:MAG: hypothetical protein HKO93_02520 [Flavobacteriales bacterium]|nr:hypothetical protein [Flavobacteriales bacterium]